ncbi:hypothetical protein PHSY_002739 [Pseudozyma hubeiensis SY62]|uniref:Bromo domain-containing protein n=1 Tax=Pseudozyma hubeiensis (strain SY62) TaxID=1305764 RepID=R9P1T0_PSEHS|nr:hypothetical protein PHSY_002739 [Pseudozyma hubeiensis SY62]GAC95164.1 hypothetical protein PHSY_002739 [Pseudozyma hubeiensis SY62]
MSRRGGEIESSNILDGPRKRLRASNNAAADDASAAAASSPAGTSASGSASASTAGMGVIERRIHSLSVEQVAQYGQKLMDTVMEATDPTDGDPLHEFFLELPDAQEYPDYYEIIKRPMALEEIQSKLDQRSYPTLPDVKHDFETICNNAKRYNLRDTPVWLKAKELHSLIKITYVQIVESLPEPSAADTSVPATSAAPTTASAVGAQDTPLRPKRIMLRASKSQARLNDQSQPKLEAQDTAIPPLPTASQPQLAQQQQSSDSKSSLLQQPSSSLTPARQQSQQPYTAAGTPSSAADDDDDADADADDDDNWDADGDSSKLTKGGLLDGRKRPGKRGKRLKATLRQLVYDLRRVVGSRGYPLVQNFDALPDRAQNPQYYQVISRPVCLRDIEHRVYEKGYINAHALFTDLELMLNNAMSYHPPEHPVWQDAAEIRQYFEREAIPALMQDGFTLEKDDVRQSALPLHLAANSTIEAHKAAYRMMASKFAAGEGASQSPEPSSRARLGSAGVAASPALSANAAWTAGSPAAFGSPSPALQSPAMPMSNANIPLMGGAPGSMPMSMPMAPPMSNVGSPFPIPAGMPHMGMADSPARPMQFPGTPGASPRNVATPEGRRPVGRPPGKGTPTRSNPYPFLERRVGPGRPKKHEAAARQAAIAAHEEMLRKQSLQDQQDQMTQQQQAAALAAQPIPQWQQQQLLQQQHQQQLLLQRQQEQAAQQHRQQQQQQQQQRRQQQQLQQQQQAQQQQAYLEQQQRQLQQQQHPHGPSPSPSHQMLPPGAPGGHSPFGSGMAVAEPPSPVKRKESVLPAEPREPPPFEGLENRTPLISNFAIGMEVEEPDGQTLAVPSLEIKNGHATQHTLQIPPNASSITIVFPLRMLNKKHQPKLEEAAADAAGADGDVSMDDASNAATAANGNQAKAAPQTNGKADDEQASSLTWPWQPELSFNGRSTEGSWTASESFIDPALLEDADGDDDDNDEGGFTTSIGYSYCQVRLLPRRGINVFEITVRPDSTYAAVKGVPAERYSIFFC